jgi:hypothetical protein
MTRPRSRAKNLDDRTIEQIVQILDGWSGKLTWEALIEEVSLRLRTRYTRQALHNHVRIKEAFASRKKALTGRDREEIEAESPELQHALQRIARLEVENERLKRENNNLLEQFARWAYNASTRALDEKFLNQTLPPVYREASIEPSTGSSGRKGKKGP